MQSIKLQKNEMRKNEMQKRKVVQSSEFTIVQSSELQKFKTEVFAVAGVAETEGCAETRCRNGRLCSHRSCRNSKRKVLQSPEFTIVQSPEFTLFRYYEVHDFEFNAVIEASN